MIPARARYVLPLRLVLPGLEKGLDLVGVVRELCLDRVLGFILLHQVLDGVRGVVAPGVGPLVPG